MLHYLLEIWVFQLCKFSITSTICTASDVRVRYLLFSYLFCFRCALLTSLAKCHPSVCWTLGASLKNTTHRHIYYTVLTVVCSARLTALTAVIVKTRAVNLPASCQWYLVTVRRMPQRFSSTFNWLIQLPPRWLLKVTSKNYYKSLAVAKRPYDCCVSQFWRNVSRRRFFCWHYRLIFNYWDVIDLQSYRIRWNKAK